MAGLAGLITDSGDSAVLLAVTIVTAAYFSACGLQRESAAVPAGFALSGVLIALLKIAFIACGHGALGIRSPSGHAALALAVYGTLALLALRFPGLWRRALPPLLILWPLLIALTRVTLGMHTPPEVILGLLTGAAAMAAVYAAILRASPAAGRKSFNPALLVFLMAGTVVLFNGFRLPAEKMLQRAALRADIPFCSE